MDVSVLGPLQVHGPHGQVPIEQHRVRAVLASLAARPRGVVERSELVADVWGVDAPPGAETSVRSYVARLRKVLTQALPDGSSVGDVLAHRGGGYVLQVEDRQLDWSCFVADVGDGIELLRGGRAGQAGAVLQRGLARWRGNPFIDIADSARGRELTAWLQEVHLAALGAENEALMATGQHERAVPRLAALVVGHPFEERFWEQLVLCLARSGRRAEALMTYSRARIGLQRELGVGPGGPLQAAYDAVRDLSDAQPRRARPKSLGADTDQRHGDRRQRGRRRGDRADRRGPATTMQRP